MAIRTGKISTGSSRAPMTVDQVKSAVQPVDSTVVVPTTVVAGKTLIVPGATVNVPITASSIVTVYGLTIEPGGSITLDPGNGRIAT